MYSVLYPIICYTLVLVELERCLAFDALALLGGNEYLVQVRISRTVFFSELFFSYFLKKIMVLK